jgi:membrane protein DedA with SNARE-associated domain
MDQVKEFLTHYSGVEAYLLFFAGLIGCGIGLPLNSDLILITASMLAAFGLFKLPILIPIAFFGLLSGDSINFFLARRFGPKLLSHAPFNWILPESKFKEAKNYFDSGGSRFVFCIRFLPFIRTALFFTAGSLQIKPRVFYLLNGTSTLIYLMILMNLAFAAGSNIEPLLATLRKFQFLLLAVLGLLLSIAVIRTMRKRQHSP